MTLQELVIKIRAETRDAARGLQSFAKKVKQVGQSMAHMGRNLTLGVTAPILAFFAAATREAALLEGAMAKFNAVFAEGRQEMLEWVDEYRDNVPLARREIVQHSAALQDLLVPMGLARDEAMGMTQDWMELAAALAAFNDIPVAQALDAIRSGLAGETEPLMRLGIDARVAALEATALAEGLMKSGDEMTNQIRLQALLIQATNQSADAINNYSEQQGSLLMLQQELVASLKDMAGDIGVILIPTMRELVGYVQQAVDWFQSLDEGTRENIVKFLALAAAVGPVLIVMGSLVSAVGTLAGVLSSVVGLFTPVAAGAAATGAAAGGAAAGTSALAGAIGALISPVGLAVIGIGVLIAAIYEYRQNADKMATSQQELNKRIIEGDIAAGQGAEALEQQLVPALAHATGGTGLHTRALMEQAAAMREVRNAADAASSALARYGFIATQSQMADLISDMMDFGYSPSQMQAVIAEMKDLGAISSKLLNDINTTTAQSANTAVNHVAAVNDELAETEQHLRSIGDYAWLYTLSADRFQQSLQTISPARGGRSQIDINLRVSGDAEAANNPEAIEALTDSIEASLSERVGSGLGRLAVAPQGG